MTQTEYRHQVTDFLRTRLHPPFKVPYTKAVYLLMLELIQFLRLNDFKIFICSIGDREFLRTYSEEAFGVPRENALGASAIMELKMSIDESVLLRFPVFVEQINHQAGKW